MKKEKATPGRVSPRRAGARHNVGIMNGLVSIGYIAVARALVEEGRLQGRETLSVPIDALERPTDALRTLQKQTKADAI